MSEKMYPIPFRSLMNWVVTEYAMSGEIFGVHKAYKASGKSLPIFGERIETPFGPAAGPNSQLAQNIIAAYVAGARFFEVKTVQKMDGADLAACVPRPCILANDEGYNQEWSTELTVPQAMDEYIKAWCALKVLSKVYGFGDPDGFVFNMSVGYDLEGIKGEKVNTYIDGMMDVGRTAIFGECKEVLKELFPQEFKWMNKDKILFTYIHSNAHPDETDTLLNSHVSAVAYEDVQDEEGKFPLLRPMSELAGKGGFLAALHFAQSVNGGPGKLLANVTGVETPIITMLGCGVVGTGAAELAAAFGNEVRILDVNMNTMLAAKKTSPANITYMISNRSNLEKCLRESDVIINGILWAKDRKDHIVYREDLKLMKPGAMIVDVACDENGAIETCRDTTHDDPIYFVDGVMHYCVDNIPSAFSQTASVTLANATLPYLLQMADKGFKKAMEDNRLLRLGMTCYDGKLTLKETALKQNREWTDADELVKVW